MKLANLTSENLIMLDATFDGRFAAINALVDKIDQAGKLTDRDQFLDAVLKREDEGPTALGEYLAVPHGKSPAVKEPVFACAFVKDEMQWKGLDGDEPVTMIFLLAIPPAEAGSTHMEVLTTLTSSLVDDEFREQLQAANSPQQVMALFGAEQETENHAEPVEDDSSSCEELAQDLSRFAYPIVLGAGILISAFLFLLL
ncbi:PTS fructose-specific enzyme IIA component-like protein [Vibrio sinaloensis DSM 21326]|uniref:PTS fructose-specific enzyme IIA component-like protein n=1 Tax=Vibrio sinaloensis DSM 21326 TaxID=945550 RepID=E8M3E4_PHOS4|nr:fructose PTS transporter subunit IIA [Vibrio sinaloensis]EGA71450.1 PTS fructose-specific enzyme IIA component-like protein [Vibrio sinaloensis DSM 21326]